MLLSVFVQQARKFLLLDKLKGKRKVKRKDCAAAFYAVPGFIAVLKITMFTEVTLNSFNIFRDIFCTNLARKFSRIITHGLVPVYYTKCFCV